MTELEKEDTKSEPRNHNGDLRSVEQPVTRQKIICLRSSVNLPSQLSLEHTNQQGKYVDTSLSDTRLAFAAIGI